MLRPLDFLARFGQSFPAWNLADSQAYTRRLTRDHYENFTVASILLPRQLRQDYCNVYAYCRWADDLADELGNPERSLELLNWWREELLAMDAGAASHPVYVALRDTVRRHSLPLDDFENLLAAFRQDQTVRHYASYPDLLEYCRYSANPVGRLVLRLNRYVDTELFSLSDSVCTALQLANHWQDIRRDWEADRVYVPDDVMAGHGFSRDGLARDITRGCASDHLKATVRDLVERAASLFAVGLPLAGRVRGRLGIEVEMFARGGMSVLAKIRSQGFDTLAHRPKVSSMEGAMLFLRAAAKWRPAALPPSHCHGQDA